MSEPDFAAFVTDHASVVRRFVLLVTDDPATTDAIVDDAWVDVYRRWRVIAPSQHVRGHALAPFVTRAIRYADVTRRQQEPVGSSALELRDDIVVDASTTRPAPTSGRAGGSGHDDIDPHGQVVRQAFEDLPPRERALVALSLVVGLDDRELRWAVGWRPPRAARIMHRAVRDLTLTAVPVVLGVTTVADGGTRLRDRVATVLTRPSAASDVDGAEVLERLRPRLTTTSQQRPRPRPGVVAAGVGAMALALLLAAVVVLQDDEATRKPAAVAADRPVPEAGMRLVGYGPVYTSVPASWSHNDLECGAPAANTVIYPDATSGCFVDEMPLLVGVPPSSVTFSDLPTSAVPLGRLRLVNQAGEFGVYATTPVHREGRFHVIVLVPQANVQMIVRTTDIHVMDDIVDSLKRVPAGYAVVPPCERLMLREAIERLDDAGLALKLIQASTLSNRVREPPVTRQTIASGAIVEKGTVVGLGFPSAD